MAHPGRSAPSNHPRHTIRCAAQDEFNHEIRIPRSSCWLRANVCDRTKVLTGNIFRILKPPPAEHYRKTGKFLDGATLVKEIRKLETSAMTTGNPVVWGSDAAVWFVMVKDAKGRFASNPLWGDGWGWALFKADAPAKNVAVSYEADCMGCHVPAAKTDRVFIQ